MKFKKKIVFYVIYVKFVSKIVNQTLAHIFYMYVHDFKELKFIYVIIMFC